MFLGGGRCSSSFGSRLFPVLLGTCKIASVCLLDVVLLSIERGASLWTTGVLSLNLGTLLRLFPSLPLIHDMDHAFRSQILVDIFVVNLNHGCIDASTEALDLADSEQSILTHLVHSHMCMLLNCLNNISGPSQLAWCCSTNLKVIFAYLGPIEHSVE